MRKSFWSKVENCKHENVRCVTEYCNGHESHCADCGVYIQECGCGFNNGMSGWPKSRYKPFVKV